MTHRDLMQLIQSGLLLAVVLACVPGCSESEDSASAPPDEAYRDDLNGGGEGGDPDGPLEGAEPDDDFPDARPPGDGNPELFTDDDPDIFARFDIDDGSADAAHLVSVYYATNRARGTSDDPKSFYGSDPDPAGRLHLGVVRVNIPPEHTPGVLESPGWRSLWREDPEQHVIAYTPAPLGEDVFYSELARLMSHASRRDAFVFVHGYNVSFHEAARRVGQIAFDVDFQGAPILFSWPSTGSLEGYPADVDRHETAVPHLRAFLLDLIERTAPERIHIVAHSMGSRVAGKAMRSIALQDHPESPLFTHLVLAAPDVNADVFTDTIAPHLDSVCSSVTVYASSEDLALKASRKFNRAVRLGESNPMTVLGFIQSIDASRLATEIGLNHSYYGDKPSILADIRCLLDADRDPELRGLTPQRSGGGLNYWTFPANHSPCEP